MRRNSISCLRRVENIYKKIFVLNRDDKAFMKSFDKGKPDVRLLFSGIRVNLEIRAHPGLLFALGRK